MVRTTENKEIREIREVREVREIRKIKENIGKLVYVLMSTFETIETQVH